MKRRPVKLVEVVENMAALTLGVARSKSLGLYLKRTLPSNIFSVHQGLNHLVSSSGLLKSSLLPFVYKIVNEWLPLNTLDWFCKTGILLAVPKKRVSHSRKRIRNFPKFPKNRTDIETCVVCRNQKLQGHLCGYCLERIREETEKVQAQMPSYDLPQPMSR